MAVFLLVAIGRERCGAELGGSGSSMAAVGSLGGPYLGAFKRFRPMKLTNNKSIKRAEDSIYHPIRLECRHGTDARRNKEEYIFKRKKKGNPQVSDVSGFFVSILSFFLFCGAKERKKNTNVRKFRLALNARKAESEGGGGGRTSSEYQRVKQKKNASRRPSAKRPISVGRKTTSHGTATRRTTSTCDPSCRMKRI